MIFGTKPVYRFAVYNKKKMHCLGKAYAFEQAPVDIKECPIKIVDQKAEIFFSNPIFNTYVLSIEENMNNNVTVLKSYDDKVTFIKSILEKNKLYTVKTVEEDEKTREVCIYQFDEYFPGYKTKGSINIKDNKPIFSTKFGSGPIHLQTNDIKKEAEAMLVSLDSDGSIFAEINNPIERTAVRIVKDLNNHKIVENGNIKGILIESKDKKINEEVNVYVKNIYPGSYCFVEDITPGIAEVELISKEGSIYKVKYKSFIGTCSDKKVSKKMKGIIYEIKGNTFKFKQGMEEEKRTKDYESITVIKRQKITDEKEIKSDQIKAIEFIKEEEDPKKAIFLFQKYIKEIKENNSLCLFYLQFLSEKKMVKEKFVTEMLKFCKNNFINLASEKLEDLEILKMLFNKKKTLAGFKKILDDSSNKEELIKENPEFLEYSIKYVYENLSSPRVVVEKVIDKSFKNWRVYANLEEGNFKRNIFRRMSQMNFKKGEMKELFKDWLSFEETNGGNVEEVHGLANEYVQKGLSKQ